MSKSRDNSFDIVARSLRLATFTFSLICLGFILIGKPLILLVLGESAAPAWPISLIVLASAAAHAMMRAMNSVTAGMGKPLLSTVALGIEVAVIAACIVPLGVRYGTMGLAICGVIGSAAALLVTARQVCRLMQLKPIRLFVPTIGDIEFALARVGAQWGDRRKKPK